jgi:hypothetical protein
VASLPRGGGAPAAGDAGPATARARAGRLPASPANSAAPRASRRAAAAAPLPQEARLELGLLHYFAGRYQDAWLELGILLERARAADADAAPGGRGGGCGGCEDAVSPEALEGARLMFEKLGLELLVAA